MTKAAKGAAALTPKQSRFVDEYLKDLNATAAYKRAGYKAKGNAAEVNAARMLRNAQVQEAIQIAMDDRVTRTEIDADYVLKRLAQIDQLDVADILDDAGNILPIRQWPKEWRISISGIDMQEMMSGDVTSIVRKFKFPDKVKNLELLGKHISVQAFRELTKNEHVGGNGGPIRIEADWTKEQLEELAREFR